jgi:hypothetical protein
MGKQEQSDSGRMIAIARSFRSASERAFRRDRVSLLVSEVKASIGADDLRIAADFIEAQLAEPHRETPQ